ncbi:MAG: TonB-dependent receptor domain-containing protein [Caulobacteraceae bacterium]
MVTLTKRVLVTTVATTVLMAAWGASAQTRQFNIPSEDAAKSIPEFARQAGVQITAPVSDLHGVKTPAIVGEQDLHAALAKLLGATGLEIASDDGGVIVLRRPAAVTAPGTARDGKDQRGEAAEVSDVVVTGSARVQRRFDVSYAVNTLSQQEIQNRAPLNFADLLGQLPGIQVEATGGEVQNITRVRGIPTDDGLALFQQDGLPLFHEINGVFFRGDDMNRYDLMTQRVEVVRGGPAPIYASQAAAIVNNITVSGAATPRGAAQVTLGDTGLYRGEAFQSGPINDNTYYAIGGFLRLHEGYRDNGFPNDRGGQIRANIKHDFDKGSIRVSGLYLNDHNVFYLPIPTADPRNPSVSLNKYIDYFSGTLNSPSLRNVGIKYLNGAGALQTDTRDLANGRHLQFGNVGVQFDHDVGGWLVAFNGGLTKGGLDFDAFYSTSNPQDANAFAAGFLGAARTAFGSPSNPVASLGYAIAGTNGAQVYLPAAASGLIGTGQYREVGSNFYSTQADLSVTRTFQTGLGSHDLRAGVYGSVFGEDESLAFEDFLTEIAGKPRTLDLVAYSAAGAPLGYVTDKGVLHYTTTLAGGKTDATVAAVYVNDTWRLTSKLSLDAGVRHEQYSYRGYGLLTTQANLGDPTTLADDATRAFTGAILSNSFKPSVTNWTAGINYDLNTHFGGYARASHLEQPPSAATAISTTPTPITTKAEQYELGLKTAFGRSYLYLTGFYVKFDPLNASFAAFNPQTGRNDQPVLFIGTATDAGVEADGALRTTDWFSLAGSLTVSDPKYADLANNAGANPAAVNGKQIIREPKIYGNIRPTFNFKLGADPIEVYGVYGYTGKRFVDFFNQTALPAYGTFGAGFTLSHDSWKLQVVGDNLADAHGLTEGNTRTDTLSGQGSAVAIYGRPIFGRNFRLVISKSW